MKRALVVAILGAVACTVAAPVRATPLPEAPGCPMLPADNVWHADVSQLPIDPKSSTYIASMGASLGMHADFGSGLWAGGPIGIPYTTVAGTQPRVPVSFLYDDESDPGPYPVPPDAPIEGGPDSRGDRHVLVVDRDECVLYELYAAYPRNGGETWKAGSGAVYDLNSNDLRPKTWTSADAAGLPILPGLVRYDEVAAGVIDHAIRVTASATQNTFIWPARHQAGDANPNLPPMGARMRLKESFDISGYPPAARVILTALKTYGMIIADNGTSWYISGAPDERWDNDILHAIDDVRGSDFEVVDESSLMVDPDSGQVAGVAVSSRSTFEGDSGTKNLVFTLSLPAPATQTQSFTVSTANGTALAGSDFVATTRTVSFRPGQTTAKFKVPIVGDTAVEPNETFVVNAGGAPGVGTIRNDD